MSDFQLKNNFFFLFPGVHLSTKEITLMLVLRIPWAVVPLPAVGAQLGPTCWMSHLFLQQQFKGDLLCSLPCTEDSPHPPGAVEMVYTTRPPWVPPTWHSTRVFKPAFNLPARISPSSAGCNQRFFSSLQAEKVSGVNGRGGIMGLCWGASGRSH